MVHDDKFVKQYYKRISKKNINFALAKQSYLLITELSEIAK